MASHARADYGQDAPSVVRNLLIGAACGFAFWGSAVFKLWSGEISIPMGGDVLRLGVAAMGLGSGIGMAFGALWLVWDSRIGKLRGREQLLQEVSWKGTEQVLDLGCGRGLLLIAAAKRLTTGKATGIDIWQSEDLSDNRPDATLANASAEGVGDRVAIETADMRELPFPDASFDVVVSRAAIHNLYAVPDRAKAIREVARVLKPGGCALIEDIRHGDEYTATFTQCGCTDIRRLDSKLGSLLTTLMTMGSLHPATLMVTKDS